MPAIVLDGKTLSRQIEANLKARVEKVIALTGGLVPILATILVGDDPASATYVKMKGSACERVGMRSMRVLLPQRTTTAELLAKIDELNASADVHGILLQHPVPEQIDERACFDRISIDKDVDGVTSLGFGRMALGEPAYSSATAGGIMRLLKHYGIDLKGKEAVIAGRSPILGKPLAMMLLNGHATVTICHSRTLNLPEIIRRAEVVVGAVGKPEFIRSEWIRDGAVVIDAGYHPTKVGDIELGGVIERCAAYTPVPGGVGPMTIVTLIEQTVMAAEKAAEF
jgi:methylenetetrahydrofolate dehydrogenase (NADP+) / methenyltetrahydrofolate cyclohydrolase